MGKRAFCEVRFSSGLFSYSQGKMAAEEGLQDTLRLQFQAMQEMQHRRLQKQMEKQKEKELSLNSRDGGPEEPVEVFDGLRLLHAGEQNPQSSFERR